MSYQSKFSDCLRETMSKRSISQATVSRLTGINSGTISRIMTGRRKNISYETIATIAGKLHMWRGRTPDAMVKYIEELEFKLAKECEWKKSFKIYNMCLWFAVIGLVVCLIMK